MMMMMGGRTPQPFPGRQFAYLTSKYIARKGSMVPASSLIGVHRVQGVSEIRVKPIAHVTCARRELGVGGRERRGAVSTW